MDCVPERDAEAASMRQLFRTEHGGAQIRACVLERELEPDVLWITLEHLAG